MSGPCTLGLDFGTNSVRALIAETATGREAGGHVSYFESGKRGVVLDPSEPLLARHNPADYLRSLEVAVAGAIAVAGKSGNFVPSDIIGIGIDATASTPMPVDTDGCPLAFHQRFLGDPSAMAWLWKDHTATAEAEEIAELAGRTQPYLGKTGGTYSSEWFWAKLLRCARTRPDVFYAAASWIDACDWIPAMLSGNTKPGEVMRSACAAGHKGLYHPDWGGWPDTAFLTTLDTGLARVVASFAKQTYPIGVRAGSLCPAWAERLGLMPGIAISVGSVDAHVGAIGSGIAPGVLVKVIGTSGVDMTITDASTILPDISGLAGVVPDSILPGYYGIEAGQSAIGDIYQWFVDLVAPDDHLAHERLQQEASRLAPGSSGLLALDWHNGNRTILMDQRLTGLLLGLTIQSTRSEIYRALVESTAFGSRVIQDHLGAHGVQLDRVIAGGGIAGKSPSSMQIFADILGKEIYIARSTQTGALGAAIAGAVAAGRRTGGYNDFGEAIRAMVASPELSYAPDPRTRAAYDELYMLYRTIHDDFGGLSLNPDMAQVMKRLISLRDRVRSGIIE